MSFIKLIKKNIKFFKFQNQITNHIRASLIINNQEIKNKIIKKLTKSNIDYKHSWSLFDIIKLPIKIWSPLNIFALTILLNKKNI
jgi:hypothetical protein